MDGASSRLDPHRWTALWAQTAGVEFCAAERDRVFADLTRRYREAGRYYHNAKHIVDCLRLFDDVAAFIPHPLAVEWAIWFHDAVYDSRARDNESRSAALATTALQLAGSGVELQSCIAGLILATQSHQPGGDANAAWLIDIDLSILGRPAQDFAAYETAIRCEYAWVEEPEFRRRRAEILAAFLARPRIFLTNELHERFELQARENLEHSLQRLRSSA